MSDFDANKLAMSLVQAQRRIAESEAAIEALDISKKLKADQAEFKKLKGTLDKALPETLKGQGKAVFELQDLLLKYTKVAALQQKFVSDPAVSEAMRAHLERRSEMFTETMIAAVMDVLKIVSEETNTVKKAALQLSAELRDAPGDDIKLAGVMDFVKRIGQFFGRLFDKIADLLKQNSKAIDASVDASKSALSDFEKALTAAKSGRIAGEIPEAFKENIQKKKDEAAVKKEDEKDSDKKAFVHGYCLTA